MEAQGMMGYLALTAKRQDPDAFLPLTPQTLKIKIRP